VETQMKAMVAPGSIFEELGLNYIGPIDGHNINELISVIGNLKDFDGPQFLHVITKKGAGLDPAEADRIGFHAIGKIKPIDATKKKSGPKYQDVFGHTIVELAEKNDKIMGVTPAMPTGSSLKFMMEAMPDRAFDVGIAEQHAVTFSAGLATQGMKPFCNIYSSFMQRAYDQVVHDVALQNLPVVFCLDRAGFAGSDGPTHHGAYDIAYMRSIPNMIVTAPMDEAELRNLMYTAQLDETNAPFSIRYPRGEGVLTNWKTPMKKVKIGTGRRMINGDDIAILTIGHIGNYATEAARILDEKGISAAHYDLRFVKPLDELLLHEVFSKFNKVITVEDGCVVGGMGSAVLEFMADHGYQAQVKRLGIPDEVIEHGSQMELHELCKFDPLSIAESCVEMMSSTEGSRQVSAG
ncbi:MAG TPA: 1-deoxy-D-xylulose-5-phosphate synthase, partial [Flavobacteriales bacterium]|nr:1-deoxy-D-xylulose-5-phosphate synthase [Flavobacteriales bacterium]